MSERWRAWRPIELSVTFEKLDQAYVCEIRIR